MIMAIVAQELAFQGLLASPEDPNAQVPMASPGLFTVNVRPPPPPHPPPPLLAPFWQSVILHTWT